MRPGSIARLAPAPDARSRREALLPILYKDLEEQASGGGARCPVGAQMPTDLNACIEQTKAKFGTWRKKFRDDIEMRRMALQDAAKARSLVPLDALIHP